MEHIIAKLLQNFEEGKMTRRQLIQSLALAATAASATGAAPAAAADKYVVKTTYLNHVGYQVADYAQEPRLVCRSIRDESRAGRREKGQSRTWRIAADFSQPAVAKYADHRPHLLYRCRLGQG